LYQIVVDVVQVEGDLLVVTGAAARRNCGQIGREVFHAFCFFSWKEINWVWGEKRKKERE
jgi:hypothetical protein